MLPLGGARESLGRFTDASGHHKTVQAGLSKSPLELNDFMNDRGGSDLDAAMIAIDPAMAGNLDGVFRARRVGPRTKKHVAFKRIAHLAGLVQIRQVLEMIQKDNCRLDRSLLVG